MNDTYKELLDEEMESSSVVFHEFLLEYKKRSHKIYCFVEGIDDIGYYRPRIEGRVNWIDVPYIPCSGKKGVLEIFDTLNLRKEFADCKILYFVDKDFDDNSNISKDVYITPSYSIENFYTSIDSFERVLKYVLRRGETDQDYLRALELFKKRQNEFHTIVSDLNALIACDRERNVTVKLRQSISEVKISDYIHISIDEVKPKAKLEDLLSRFSYIESEKKEEMKNKINLQDKQQSYRGKFEIQFYTKLLELLISDSNSKNLDQRKFFAERVKTLDIDVKKSPIQVLSAYASTPSCLIKYINAAVS